MQAIQCLVFALHFQLEKAVIRLAFVFPLGDLSNGFGVGYLKLFLLSFEVNFLLLHLLGK